MSVEKIVGSVGRHRDFDRAFHRGEELPPVVLYKVGEAYFVEDGNHYVSVARYQEGVDCIDAEVVELRSLHPRRSS